MLLAECLPADWRDARLLGRVLTKAGPSPVLARGGRLYDLSNRVATTAQAVAFDDLDTAGVDLGSVDELTVGSAWLSDPDAIQLLSPLDLQCIKASGVTFAVSALERVIEERARGDADAANAVRQSILDRIGGDLKDLRPGSEQAEAVKAQLIAEGLWSQYLEVAIGPYAEIFTKAPVLASVGWGAEVGVRADSAWNNPEPEVVVICDPSGRPVGASLGNDVNLRDIEGRSALLLGKAKDNNASASVGPFIRLFDDGFGMDDVRAATVRLEVEGTDGFMMTGESSMSLISRDPEELVRQTLSSHQYPDGFALYLGTMFAPIDDRDAPGKGFTHKIGDRVRVSSEKLGVLENVVATCDQAPLWKFGVLELMQNLAGRGLLGVSA
ncbi:MAG: fumarylacetoacetate (FAA) hydrolase family protein [Brevundimonas sp.]|uniref:fumarylacetoacetate hydrolase family protein n=1 Tax=Brevundimonas sp. GW460-12-10-14-LB2 TaxID=1827469 RepID=UPI0007BCD251|nr:fumarylacetoacetate hydrolase family protein [Brevundimonas sp. GW460-12-10-14-LB2]ANC52567.1 fumarylacetoacetate hydrolase [Brevundimonas sp. GW460-12-10-14-LB2]MEA3472542.1 fumarylacetoacetate hydrolase family protein [Pseudomonadota bacterium]